MQGRLLPVALMAIAVGCGSGDTGLAADAAADRPADASAVDRNTEAPGADTADADAPADARDAVSAEAEGDAADDAAPCSLFPDGIEVSVKMPDPGSADYTALVLNSSCSITYLMHACCGPVTSWHLDEKQLDGTWKELPPPVSPCGCAAADSWRTLAATGWPASLPFRPGLLGATAGTYRLAMEIGRNCESMVACAATAVRTSASFTYPP